MDEKIEFAKKVIKGKIAEQVFEFMFREAGEYDVIPFGYEYSHPELAQHLKILKEKDILRTLQDTPDFILISNDRTEVYFVEVKYRHELYIHEIKHTAETLIKHWQHAYLFIATPKGFFYEPCNTIINNNGFIGELYEKHVPKKTQDKYLQLLNEFEKEN